LPYCRYCLIDYPAEEMPSSRTCKKCREQQFKRGQLKARKRRQSRNSRERNPVLYYFHRKEIKHKPFPSDIAALEVILKRALGINRYASQFIHVDHIIPVIHPHVSGLTVSWNLQLLTREENSKKKNYCDLDLEASFLLLWAKSRGL
jgi:hypothetical protein